ncbi:RIB43A-like with coiled-coils protein 2 isoform X2 [Belonocnema kinseyi]|uniref:RIB43A-like with coiled-coils protein 2 isoform X2 n=1 Tax=Belonocnema kinseyi TaxID=2817044 RepID=UPI00143D8D7D|nr:RIB43A-like with coiled-coils protein 2 isoform X2 [Belonocnema kinseyi]
MRFKKLLSKKVNQFLVDKEFLDKQIEEKKHQRDVEKAKELQMDEALVRNSKLAILLERREEEEKKKILKEINAYRQFYQRPEDRRDYDLYDPEGLKKTLQATLECGDPKFGSSSQVFQGEDCKMQERLKEQKEQMQSWVMQQISERRAAEKERRDAEKAYQEAVVARDKRAISLEHMEQDCRRRLNEATARFNRALADEQEYRRRCEEIQDEEDNRAEIYNHVTGDFLTEAKEQAESNRGPNKPLASRYKGMTSEELKAYREEQLRQMEDIQKLKMEEKQKNVDWNRLMAGNAYAAETYHRELERKKAQLNKQIAEENLRLAEQQKSQQEYLNRVIYKNRPSREFFEQFNKGTR